MPVKFFWSLLRRRNTGSGGGGGGALFPFTFDPIPYTDPDLINHGRGAEQWHNGSAAIDNPVSGDPLPSLDKYNRFQWSQFEGPTIGSYDWEDFDNEIQYAINNGQLFSFGIMTLFAGAETGGTTYDGAGSSYPEYVHDEMFSEADAADRDYDLDGWWIPNWNHPYYLERLRALHAALYTYITTTSYVATSGPHNGETINYADVIYCVDIRGFGQYGEWHTIGFADDWNDFPGNQQPTIATLKEIIDLHTEEFPDWPNVMMIAAYDSGNSGVPFFHPYPEVGHYSITTTNAWGPVGSRRDQVGAKDAYLPYIMELNDTTYLGSAEFSVLILDKFRTAPNTGEPPGWIVDQYDTIVDQIETLGTTSFGNGNYNATPDATTEDNLRAAWKRSGYRIKITEGEAPLEITRSVSFEIKTTWDNSEGLTPTYLNWDVVFELQDTVTSDVVWSGTSDKVLKLFLPEDGPVETIDNFTVPGSVDAGEYKLVVRVKDPNGYMQNMKLANEGIQADGSYLIWNVDVL